MPTWLLVHVTWANPTPRDAVGSGVTAASQMQFTQHALQVILDRMLADAEPRRDLFVQQTQSNQFEHFQLARRQVGRWLIHIERLAELSQRQKSYLRSNQQQMTHAR